MSQDKLVNDVIALVRARNPIILIVTVEEKRVERALVEPLMTLRNTKGDPNGLGVRLLRIGSRASTSGGRT